ncbi:uncharacterized protein [Dysidea avara]|uniref:uncharacterized protein isoform X2 n=1 Tax=Dysidea avara TaxID=196820 RepID=UPI00332059CC
MGVDFELPTVKRYICKLLVFPELFIKFVILILSSVGIALTFEFGFDYEITLIPETFCAGEIAFRYCINNIGCNAVIILVTGVLIFIDLARACLDNRQWKQMVGALVLIVSLPMAGYLLASSALLLKNYIDVCENDARCTDIVDTRFLAVPIVGFIAAIFYLIIAFSSFLRILLSQDD